VLLDCVIYCAFYSILFRGAVFSGHGVCATGLAHTGTIQVRLIIIINQSTYQVYAMNWNICTITEH